MEVTDPAKIERIEEVVKLAVAHTPAGERASVEMFAREYFRQVDPDDIVERSAEELMGALLSHWQFGARREPGKPKVRVLSPTAAEHGWTSRHTVIEIVNDDMPFLVDSTTMEINRRGSTLHLIVHPIFAVERNPDGTLKSIRPRSPTGAVDPTPRESWMHIEIDRLVEAQMRADVLEDIERVLGDVRSAVTDWKPMVARLHDAIADLERNPPPAPREEVAESCAFLQWLTEDHLVLLGYRQHELVTRDGVDALHLVAGSGLGLLREDEEERHSDNFAALPAAARTLARSPSPQVIVTKANRRATVHRPGYTDYIGVKRFNERGEAIGEHRFIGLLTSTAYSARVTEIPLLRGKLAAVAARAGFLPGSHLAKALNHVFDTFPRDELFQISAEDFYEIALGILQLGERQRLRIFIRHDQFERFVSCLVFVPRDVYSTDLRLKFQEILIDSFNGIGAEFDVLLGDAILARIQFTVRTTPGQIPSYDRHHIERRLTAAARRWDDELREALIEEEGEARGIQMYKRWAGTFPAAFRERVSARAAVADVRKVDTLSDASPFALSFYRPLGSNDTLGFKIYRAGAPVVLSESLPMLEHMGVRVLSENSYRIGPDGAAQVWIHDFTLQAQMEGEAELETIARLFEDSFAREFSGRIESDDFNRLVLLAGLAADEIVVLRAYAKYLKQIGFALSQAYIEATLAAHPRIARLLVSLFRLRFDPAHQDLEAAERQKIAIEQALEKVTNLNEDRVLRQYLALILATLRTNYWRTGMGHSGAAGERRTFLSFKVESAKVPGLPEPKPLYEIFVYSARFEGIHLRGGKVARGGLRWSDRPEDFRTEVLGLVKAQMVKNTVIVPVGSKGGFVLKKAPPATDRDAYLKEGVACYQDYLRGLLDLTDNLVGGKTVPPPHVVRFDGDDPYLVVAADKGTATFSDYANAISKEYGHWLGDAFASGGSAGYDHKKMGITARGAWESVKRHFREMGVDTQTTDFTVAGIGDMSGDVFGNGMLLSRHIKLVAAFDHRHIFLDPNPDPAPTFEERQRLFDLPRSSWADYNAELISAGGGVWPRSAKSVPISPQVRERLGIDAETLAPNELVTAILKAPVDLLYNGGIGTYVKAEAETHADVGDRANDAVRINGADLRCKVVGEGGNLGVTQRGRIEAALAGVRIYTDAIDNSAGVDTSDHEVNIKILLGLAIADGELTEKQRNTLLAEMTDDVAGLVLRDNYFQTQALSIAGRIGVRLIDQQARFIRFLEKFGLLNRAIEFLPSDEEIEERKAKGRGLTGPELAVLLAYSKMWLFDELLESDVPEDPWVGTALARYFPRKLADKFGAWIPRHPLRREIVATHVLNSMVNRVGSTFVQRLSEMTGAPPPQVVRAYLLTREVFGYVPMWQQIEALDAKVPDAVQADMVIEGNRLLTRAVTWFTRSRRLAEPMEVTLKRLAPAVAALRVRLAGSAQASPKASAWIGAGVPSALAESVAMLQGLYGALDIAEIAETTRRPLDEVAEVHASIAAHLGLTKLRAQIDLLPADSYWQSLAKAALGDDLAGLQRAIALDAVNQGGDGAAARLAAWEARNGAALERARRLLAEFGDKGADLAMLSVALRELRNLA
ncbi:MAG: NAD-glutamate dehydrogenase [Gemmatimonadota bacterium]